MTLGKILKDKGLKTPLSLLTLCLLTPYLSSTWFFH